MFDSQRAPVVSDAMRLLDQVCVADSQCMSLLTSCQCFAKGVQRDVRMQLDPTQPSSKGLTLFSNSSIYRFDRSLFVTEAAP